MQDGGRTGPIAVRRTLEAQAAGSSPYRRLHASRARANKSPKIEARLLSGVSAIPSLRVECPWSVLPPPLEAPCASRASRFPATVVQFDVRGAEPSGGGCGLR